MSLRALEGEGGGFNLETKDVSNLITRDLLLSTDPDLEICTGPKSNGIQYPLTTHKALIYVYTS